MEREEQWKKRIREKLFVCEKEWEGKWELEKLKVWKLGKRKWENTKTIGSMVNVKDM